ncbi:MULTISPECIES: DUF1003 domain-containing protein [Arthrobacter]|uniref:DUF1003 domain-containing protein n=1 Tax=Arthrobacter oryzae TaxID=409290 RepID=A0A3N0C1Q3_9MICC|nr:MULTISPECIES: DUF1003 domain-containing protein [Arthrobacter]QYF90394.1 DUF1003 domain-containing protein [Arthrobacter sp. PAMC25284]RNL55970.1 DUF1003 domain-containing protein [Arthrobacter oryzae]
MKDRHQTWHDRHTASLTQGQRAADVMRNGMGSWPFVGSFIGFMLIWAAINTLALATNAWDPYPYILLNLLLSMLAGLQGAILLIAAKRQDAIAAAMAQHDYDTNVQAKAEIELLMAVNNQQLQILQDLKRLATAQGVDPARGPHT